MSAGGLMDALSLGRSDDGDVTTLWYELEIAADAATVWAAITRPEFVREFYYGLTIDADWTTGGVVRYLEPDGAACMLGVISSLEPGRSFSAEIRYLGDAAAALDPPSRVVWDLTEVPGGTRLRVEHRGLAREGRTLQLLEGGWPVAMIGIKALLEAGSAEQVQQRWPQHRRAALAALRGRDSRGP